MTTMKVQVSKVMAKAIAKAMKERNMRYESVSVVTMTEREYCWRVCDSFGLYEAQDNGDYDWLSEEYKVIRIDYPWEYYANPAYLTTKRLREVLRSCGTSRTIDNFMNALCESIEV